MSVLPRPHPDQSGCARDFAPPCRPPCPPATASRPWASCSATARARSLCPASRHRACSARSCRQPRILGNASARRPRPRSSSTPLKPIALATQDRFAVDRGGAVSFDASTLDRPEPGHRLRRGPRHRDLGLQGRHAAGHRAEALARLHHGRHLRRRAPRQGPRRQPVRPPVRSRSPSTRGPATSPPAGGGSVGAVTGAGHRRLHDRPRQGQRPLPQEQAQGLDHARGHLGPGRRRCARTCARRARAARCATWPAGSASGPSPRRSSCPRTCSRAPTGWTSSARAARSTRRSS